KPIIGVGRGPLHASRPELVGITNTFPVLYRLRFPPAKIAQGRLRKRNSLEAAHARIGRGSGLDETIGGRDPVRCEARAGHGRGNKERDKEKFPAARCAHRSCLSSSSDSNSVKAAASEHASWHLTRL